MQKVSVSQFILASRIVTRVRRAIPFLLLPAVLLCLVSVVAFRTPAVHSFSPHTLSIPLQLPPGWEMPPVPADNPITNEKFVLGRQLFYEVALSGDGKTSCGTCHNSYLSFAARGSHGGAFGDTSKPARMVPRLINVAYDTVLTWDGHIQTLEQQVQIAVQKKGDLQGDTSVAFSKLASNPAYAALFAQAFGDPAITLDRVTKAIATFERCLISGNSPYDQYINGDTSAMSSSAVRGMNLFFNTAKTNCTDCHNNLGSKTPNVQGNIFSDNNYYRTGTFEPQLGPGGTGGYGLDTTSDTLSDTLRFLDAGRAAVTRDSEDIGKFRTPTLRNVALTPPFGADGTVFSLAQVLENYNMGGSNRSKTKIPNQDPRIKALGLDSGELLDLEAFLNSLTDLSFISNPAFQDPGAAAVQVDDHIISNDLSVYPNPASGFVNVECPDFAGSTEATLISERGATVWQQSLNSDGKLRLDLSGISNGSYRLILRSGEVWQSIPIVLQQ
jgi:cytochrome c peroxidase